ncbi:hypothetical protein D3C81_1966680 [compost metagenome]
MLICAVSFNNNEHTATSARAPAPYSATPIGLWSVRMRIAVAMLDAVPPPSAAPIW